MGFKWVVKCFVCIILHGSVNGLVKLVNVYSKKGLSFVIKLPKMTQEVFEILFNIDIDE